MRSAHALARSTLIAPLEKKKRENNEKGKRAYVCIRERERKKERTEEREGTTIYRVPNKNRSYTIASCDIFIRIYYVYGVYTRSAAVC